MASKPLVTDDYLEVEEAIQSLQPELVLGTQMERHIAKRLRIPCAVISAPVHVQDFPARYSPQMGFEGANVLFDTWVHPLVMGLEEHLLTMFRDDFEFSDASGASHLGHGASPPGPPVVARSADAMDGSAVRGRSREGWSPEAEKELLKIPFFVRGKARRNTEKYRRRAGPRRDHARHALRREGALCPVARPVHVVIVTLDNHLSGAAERAAAQFAREKAGDHDRFPRRRRLGPQSGRARPLHCRHRTGRHRHC